MYLFGSGALIQVVALAVADAAVESAAMAVDVCAHITGTVWKILVEVGQQVKQDQTLIILESMKMEMPLEAPDDGSVEAILVEPGQAVEEGDVLLKLTS